MSDMKQDLRELVDEWKSTSQLYMDAPTDSEQGMALQEWRCANQLEEILDRYSDTGESRSGGANSDE